MRVLRAAPALLCLLLAAFVGSAVDAAAAPAAGKKPGRGFVAARVDGHPIASTEVDAQARVPAGSHPATPAEAHQLPRWTEALDRLIDRQLLLAECRRQNTLPSRAAVAKALAQRRADAVDPAEVDADAGRAAVQLRLCTAGLLAAAVDAPVTEEELKAHYEAHRERYAAPADATGRLWELDVAADSPVEVWEEARQRLAAALAADRGGADGRVVAPGPALSGGGTGIHPRPVTGDDPAWGDTLRALQPGAVSAPRRSTGAWVAVERLPDMPGLPRALSAVKTDVERAVRQERRTVARQALLARLRGAARIERAP